METKLSFRYDREADILHIDKCSPYADQESEELGDEVIARINPSTHEIENLEVRSRQDLLKLFPDYDEYMRQTIADAGIVVLGQTVNAYRYGSLDFAGLLARVHEIPGLQRLRFTTSHPAHVTERLADALRDLPRLCPYLHLPVQSGSDRVLASMRRGYGRQEYLDIVAMLRGRVPSLALSSDVIVGHPGETEADFEATLSLLEAVGFDGLFAFMYSPRPGTSAFRLRDDVPAAEKRRRLALVNELQQRRQRGLHASRVGMREPVLVDTLDGEGRLSGRTPEFRIVHFDGPPYLVGRTVEVAVMSAGPNALVGRLETAAQPVH